MNTYALIFLLITPHIQTAEMREYGTTYLAVQPTFVSERFVGFVGEGFNPHGDFSAISGSAAVRGDRWVMQVTSTLDTIYDQAEYRGYYILSMTMNLSQDTLSGDGSGGNVDVNYSHANDYFNFGVHQISELEYEGAKKTYVSQ